MCHFIKAQTAFQPVVIQPDHLQVESMMIRLYSARVEERNIICRSRFLHFLKKVVLKMVVKEDVDYD